MIDTIHNIGLRILNQAPVAAFTISLECLHQSTDNKMSSQQHQKEHLTDLKS